MPNTKSVLYLKHFIPSITWYVQKCGSHVVPVATSQSEILTHRRIHVYINAARPEVKPLEVSFEKLKEVASYTWLWLTLEDVMCAGS